MFPRVAATERGIFPEESETNVNLKFALLVIN